MILLKPYFFMILTPKKDTFNNFINDLEKYPYGRILYQNPYKFNEEIIIAVDDSLVNVNDYVVNEKGLLGIIKKKYKNMAIVRLITSKDFYLQVQINNCYGILQNNPKLIVNNIDHHCLIKEQDTIYTSNLGGTPYNIPIGVVDQIILDDNFITDTFIVKQFNNEVFPSKVVIVSRNI